MKALKALTQGTGSRTDTANQRIERIFQIIKKTRETIRNYYIVFS